MGTGFSAAEWIKFWDYVSIFYREQNTCQSFFPPQRVFNGEESSLWGGCSGLKSLLFMSALTSIPAFKWKKRKPLFHFNHSYITGRTCILLILLRCIRLKVLNCRRLRALRKTDRMVMRVHWNAATAHYFLYFHLLGTFGRVDHSSLRPAKIHETFSKSCLPTNVGVPHRSHPFILPTILQYLANYVNSRYGCDALGLLFNHGSCMQMRWCLKVAMARSFTFIKPHSVLQG